MNFSTILMSIRKLLSLSWLLIQLLLPNLWATLAFGVWSVQASPHCPHHCGCQLDLTFQVLTIVYFECIGSIYTKIKKIILFSFPLRFPGMWNKNSCNYWRHGYTPQTPSFSINCRSSSWRGQVRLSITCQYRKGFTRHLHWLQHNLHLASAETGSSVLFIALCSIATSSIICGFYSFPKWTSKVLCSYLTVSVALNYEFIHKFGARKSHWNNIT